MLVLEDLHWADRSTRDLIGFLVRSARLPQVLLLATYRTDELHRGHPLRPFLAELDRVRGVQRLELDRLDREGTAEMLEPPARRRAGATHSRRHPRARPGQPVLHRAVRRRPATRSCCDIPHSLRDLLLTRVDQLPRAGAAGAAGGRGRRHRASATSCSAGSPGIDEAELESALRAVVAAQLIVVDADGGYEFRHALVREAVHDDLLPGEHARLHARYAEAIEAEPQLVAAGRAPAEIAHHWHAAHDHPQALVAGQARRRRRRPAVRVRGAGPPAGPGAGAVGAGARRGRNCSAPATSTCWRRPRSSRSTRATTCAR